MKRLIAFLVLVALSFGGCASISLTAVQQVGDVELPAPLDAVPPAPTGDSRADQVERVLLNYISADRQQLSAQPRSVVVSGDASLAEQAMRELLEFEDTNSLRAVAPEGTRLNWIEQSERVVTLDLTVDALLFEAQELCEMNAAITNTLTALDGIDYVNVLIGGKDESAMMLPNGTMEKTDLTLTALWAQQRVDDERFDKDPESAQIHRNATLYFAGWQDNRLLPEVRQLLLDTHEFAELLLRALIEGPKDTPLAHAVLPADARLTGQAEIDTPLDDGRRVLDLPFEEGLLEAIERDGLSIEQMLASLTLTMCRFLPEIDGVRVFVGGRLMSGYSEYGQYRAIPDGVVTPDMFDGIVGRVAKLYFAHADGALCAVDRLLDRQSAVSPRALIEQLIEGPYAFDADSKALPVMPDGATSADFLGVRIEDHTALVNLSSNFYRLCQGFTLEQERNLVYAIVNTLCELDGVSCVRFYVAGEAVDRLVNGIYLRGTLLPNIGLVAP